MHADDQECDDDPIDKNDIVEPVVFKEGVLRAQERNDTYEDYNLPGVGRRILLSEDEKKERKVKYDLLSTQFLFVGFTLTQAIRVLQDLQKKKKLDDLLAAALNLQRQGNLRKKEQQKGIDFVLLQLVSPYV